MQEDGTMPSRLNRIHLLLAGLALLVVGAAWSFRSPLFGRSAGRFRPALDHLATSAVRRADLNVTLTAGGQVDSSHKTVIKCQLENLQVRVQGNVYAGGGAATILSLVDEGATVKRGDVLCRLDSSEYEEMVRQQLMNVERVNADHRQAELDLDVARVTVREFREGTLKQVLENYQSRIALSQADWERGTDRLKWSRRMLAKGYVPASQVVSEELALARAALTRSQVQLGLRVYQEKLAHQTGHPRE